MQIVQILHLVRSVCNTWLNEDEFKVFIVNKCNSLFFKEMTNWNKLLKSF